MKFTPQSHGKTNTATYATVKEALIQSIQRSYKGGEDVVKSLKDLQLVDLDQEKPVRKRATSTDADDNAFQQKGYDMEYQEELRGHRNRKDYLKQGMNKAYALIFTSYCSKTMQSRIEEHPEFKTKIEDDPIALLEVIKTLMHDTVRAQYPLVSVTEALGRLLNVKQMENESLLDYVKRFKQLRDVAKSQMGTKILEGFVENQAEYQAANQTEKANLQNEAFEKWMPYLLIRGSDQAK